MAGKRFTIAGVECYLVEPRDRATFRDQALILIPDATGIGNPELRLLAGTRMSAHRCQEVHMLCVAVTFWLVHGCQRGCCEAYHLHVIGVYQARRQTRCSATAATADGVHTADADRYATEGNFLVVLPDIIDKGDVRACPHLASYPVAQPWSLIACTMLNVAGRATLQASDRPLVRQQRARVCTNMRCIPALLAANTFCAVMNLMLLDYQAMSLDVLDKYAALAGVGSHSHNFLAKGATRVHDAVLGCGLQPPPQP